ncbi:heterokaryon incompatibility protein-domain-containing protein [Stachybotrys elegans]|uniref:Heterokaryon incompatibility protein-domain-containing protein n=1 Tax=Stachybotrys elegans TaxID=80388 RepID=A0A8K0WKG2_9HYPO|nr:heterokaryon incompatibility protein-domain-containing protein [Stachybotrys elegans]
MAVIPRAREMAPLDYSKYPLQQHQIRLISLEDRLQPRWKLGVHDLVDGNIRYYAVSYTWGPPLLEDDFAKMSNRQESPVQFETGVVNVSQNLASFLAQVIASSSASQTGEGDSWTGLDLSSAKFWIDAVCINQKDSVERSHQVSTMMARIYESAEGVISWLGDSDTHTERAFAHLQALSDNASLVAWTLPASNFGNTREHWESTAKLFERTYWNRSWIIQEVVLAKSVTVCCGRHSAEWGQLSKASHNISTGTWKAYFDTRGENLALQTLKLPRPSSYAIPTVLKAVRDSVVRDHWATVLLHSLIRSRQFEATNEEDKVYALLGLVQKLVDVGKIPLLRPEFGNVGRTYLNTAIQLLRDCEDLLVLTCVEGKSFQTVDLDGDALPSWVPDWSCRLPLGLRVTGLKRYSADACFIPPGKHLSREEKLARWPADINQDENTVTLQALKIDEISHHGESKRDILKDSNFLFPRLLGILLSLPSQYAITQEAALEALWRTLIANTAGQGRTAPPKSSSMGSGFATWFWQRVDSAVVGNHKNGHRWNELKQQFNSFRCHNKDWQNICAASADTPVSETSSCAEYISTFSHGKFLRPFLTQKGYLGLGSQSLQEGDTIWVVPRSRVPLIFRQTNYHGTLNGYHCELVGAAYLHGFMDGETLSLASATEGIDLQEKLESIIIH